MKYVVASTSSRTWWAEVETEGRLIVYSIAWLSRWRKILLGTGIKVETYVIACMALYSSASKMTQCSSSRKSDHVMIVSLAIWMKAASTILPLPGVTKSDPLKKMRSVSVEGEIGKTLVELKSALVWKVGSERGRGLGERVVRWKERVDE
jgi:hypothetical protein